MFIVRPISRLMFGLSALVCMTLILGVLVVDVVLRYVFNAPLTWSHEFCSLMLFLTLTMAFPQTWLRHAHIRAELLGEALSSKVQTLIARLCWALVAAFMVVLIWQNWKDAEFMLLIGETSSELNLPIIYFRVVLGVIVATTLLMALLKLFSRSPEGNSDLAGVD